MIKKLLLLLLLLAPILCGFARAQSFEILNRNVRVEPIDGLWRFNTGDDPAWADPGFDDSQWPLLETGKSWSDQGYPDYYGYAWYRIRVKLPANSGPLAIELGKFYTSAEVYVDGKLAGTIGRMRPTPEWDFQAGNNVVPLPTGTAGSVEIAVRMWEFRIIAHYRPGGFLEHPRIGPLDDLVQADFSTRARFFARNLLDLAVDSLAACLGLFSLALFLMRRRATEYAWAALWLFSYALSRAGKWIAVLAGSPVLFTQGFTDAFLLATLFLFCLLFVWRFLALRTDNLLRTGIVLALLLFPEYLLIQVRWLTVTQAHTIWFFLVLGITVIIFLRLFRSARAGNYEARLLLVPFLLMMGAEDANQVAWVLFSFRIVPVPPLILGQFGLFTVYWYNPCDLLALLALGLALVLRFTRSAERDERLSAELDAARSIQAQLVPLNLPAVMNLRFDAAYRPAAEVGGDFYQVIPQRSGSTLIVVGDVSGKGLKAAMTGTLAIGALRSLAHEELSPAQILTRLNDQFAAASDGGFITCLCARIGADGNLILANAGHLAPYRNGEEIELESGLPLGIAPGVTYCESTICLAPNDQLTFLSDGVIEARNPQGELFGFDRTAAISGQSADEIAKTAELFGQEDDITVLTLAFAPVEVLRA
ncbi:MAG: SpoIIE family protein phosphatase [Terracidiphilus sp.]|jgi:hypothetical protein